MTNSLLHVLRIWVAASVPAIAFAQAPNPASAGAIGFDPATLPPFTRGGLYLGKYETGLYPGGSNEMPSAHRQAGERMAASLGPLDSQGQPDDRHGRVLALVLGHSNCRMYFGALQKHLASRPAELHPRFELLNAAVGGQQLPQIVRLEGPVWDTANKLTSRPGYSTQQVQVLFLHTTYHGWKNERREPPGPFPQTMEQMQRDLATVLQHCLRLYPHLKIAYLTCDGFRHFTGYEPHVWQEAFAMKWLIASQIAGEPETFFEGRDRRLPWLTWGPYIWDNRWDRSYFTDGVHPASKALDIFVDQYWRHLSRDSAAKPWLLTPGNIPSSERAAQAQVPPSAKSGTAPLTRPLGPLRVSAANPRYFADAGGRAVYLTGSHTWQSLQDGILSNYTAVTQPFDYPGYLNLLQTNHHNCIRLWRWELTTHEPQPWQRTGPGQALDGKPKFDLRQFNQPYFDRLRSRVIAARDRGIYVSVMLFEDWIFMNQRKDYPLAQHPFHKDNNVSGIDGDPNGDGWGIEIHTLKVPAVLEVQKACVRKVIETVNDLDNVLYEICNEGVRHTREWQYEMVRFVRSVEAKLPKQHPVGMTSVGDMNEDCLKSPADWTSLATTGWDQPKDPWTSAPPAADGHKVCLLDTDHIGWKVFSNDAAFTRAWVWKSFTRGHNTLLMENLADSAGWIAGRAAMGHTRRLAERVNLAALIPQPELASTRYCLAQSGREYVVYLPDGGKVTVDLSAASGTLAVEWLHAADGTRRSADAVVGGGPRSFESPFAGDAVLYLRAEVGVTNPPMIFPGKDWGQASPESQGMDPAKLRAAMDYLARSLTEHGGAGTVFIARHGHAIWQGLECDREFQIFSATKSFTSTVLGLLIDDGKVTLNTRAEKFEPALAGQYSGVTLRHFATMTSGYDSAGGSYEFDAQGRGDSWNPGPPAPPLFPPGARFRYWDDAMSQFGQVLTKAAGQPLDQVFKARIAEPIGMTRWRWTSNDTPTGRVLCWTGGMRTSARELARMGHLFLNRGHWGGRQLLSTSWVDQATAVQVPPTIPNDVLPRSRGAGVYGFNWWVNGIKPDGQRLWPGAPPRTFYANGLHNNVCIVVPEWRLVIARTNGGRTDGSANTPANVDKIWSGFFSRLAEALIPEP